MAKARRAPRGLQKSEILNVRVQPLTKQELRKAAKASGRTVSAEAEYQLHRALFEMRAPLYPVLKRVCEALGNDPELSKTARWAEDPELFNRAVNMFTAAIEMFRPIGSTRREPTDRERDLAVAYALDLLNNIVNAGETPPGKRQSHEQRRLVKSGEELRAVGAEEVVRNAAMVWRETQRLMAAPATLSAQVGFIVDDNKIKVAEPGGKLAPKEKETKK